jgi:hypothetical protein
MLPIFFQGKVPKIDRAPRRIWSMIMLFFVHPLSCCCDTSQLPAQQDKDMSLGSLAPVTFLQGVRFDASMIRNEENRGSFVLCEALIQRIELNDPTEFRSEEISSGYFECTELSKRPVAEYMRALARYPEQLATQTLHIDAGCGRSFSMNAVVNDTLTNHLLRHGAFAPVLTALVSRIAASHTSAGRNARRTQADHRHAPQQESPAPGPGLVVDLGCNQGLVSLIALAHGCAAVCVEPNPHLVPILAASIVGNRFPAAAAVVHAAAAAAWEEVRMDGYECGRGMGRGAGGGGTRRG